MLNESFHVVKSLCRLSWMRVSHLAEGVLPIHIHSSPLFIRPSITHGYFPVYQNDTHSWIRVFLLPTYIQEFKKQYPQESKLKSNLIWFGNPLKGGFIKFQGTSKETKYMHGSHLTCEIQNFSKFRGMVLNWMRPF